MLQMINTYTSGPPCVQPGINFFQIFSTSPCWQDDIEYTPYIRNAGVPKGSVRLAHAEHAEGPSNPPELGRR